MTYNPLAFGQILVAMGVLVFAAYLYSVYKKTADAKQDKGYGGVFVLLGIIASVFGFGLYLTEPIAGQYIEIYGVGYLIFTLLMLAGGLTLLFGWDKRPASYLALVGGLSLLNSGYTVWANQLSKEPLATAGLFVLSGIAAAGSAWMTHGDVEKKRRWILVGIVIFVVLGLFALYSGMMAQQGHVASAIAKAAV